MIDGDTYTFYSLYCAVCNLPWIGKTRLEKCPKCGGDNIDNKIEKRIIHDKNREER